MRRLHAPSGRAAFQVPRPAGGGGLAAPPGDGDGSEAAAGGGEGAGTAAPAPAVFALPSATAPPPPPALAVVDALPSAAAAAPPPPRLPPQTKRAKFAALLPIPSRPPLASLGNANTTTAGPSSTAAAATAEPATAFYTVLYCKKSGKKRVNKSFADGVLSVKGDSTLTLMDDEGKVVGRTRLRGCGGGGLPPGATGEVGAWEFEVGEAVPASQFASGELFIGKGGGGGGGPSTSAASYLALARPAGGGGGGPAAPRAPVRHVGLGGAGRPAAAAAGAAAAPTLPPPLFDPYAPDALVLDPGVPGVTVPVVADPFLVRRMRPHQREGLAFLYAAVTGARTPGLSGCVLAHEMGLGKTLTAIALAWTLLRQGPAGRPLGRRTVVACPSSLVDNWAAEAKKWLGDERFKVIALRPGPGVDAPGAVAGFLHGGVHPCLVASYEALRKVGPALAGRVDLLVCDEGHRLKATAGNQTIAALKAIGCKRTVLLTGTPLQNNLSELYAVLDFVAPGFLGSHAAFTRVFADPIARARDPGARPAEVELGARRAAELASRVGAVVLKGPPASQVNAGSLPPCAVYDVFLRLTPAAASAYKAVLASKAVTRLTGGRGGAASASVLPAIGLLRSLCIAPGLALGRGGGGGGGGEGGGDGDADNGPHAGAAARDAGLPSLLRSLGASDPADPASSSKLAAVVAISAAAVSRGDKVVVVSTSTAALDAVGGALAAVSPPLATVRIDGAVDAARRQAVVDAFNNRSAADPAYGGSVLLLSMRAGGAGLNLVGASVLVMTDMDWNPAVCAQAAARCWRPGQTRPCAVLRLHTAGTIDERLLQRVHHKSGLSVALEGGGKGAPPGGGGPAARRPNAPAFTPAELRALFTLDAGVATCVTRGLLVKGEDAAASAWAVDAREGGEEDAAAVAAAPLLAAAAAAADVTWVHREAMAGDGGVEEEEEEGEEEGAPAAAAPPPPPPGGEPSSADGVDALEIDE